MFCLLGGITIYGQINLQEGTVTAIAYWENDDHRNYKVSETNLITADGDTTDLMIVDYDVKMKITDSLSTGYVVEWTRKNYTFSGYSEIEQKIMSILSDFPIVFSTNEFGSDVKLLNFESIIEMVASEVIKLNSQYEDNHEVLRKISTLKKEYASDQSIVNKYLSDIQQYTVYHGAKYLLGESVTNYVKLPNAYGGDSIDATGAVLLDEILPENDTYVIKSFQSVDPSQLKAVTYDYLSSLNMVDGELPAYEDFPTVLKQMWGGSEIQGRTGWVIFSQESEQVTTGSDMVLKERFIEWLKE